MVKNVEEDDGDESAFVDYAVYAVVAVSVTSLAYVSIPHATSLLKSAIHSCNLNTSATLPISF